MNEGKEVELLPAITPTPIKQLITFDYNLETRPHNDAIVTGRVVSWKQQP